MITITCKVLIIKTNVLEFIVLKYAMFRYVFCLNVPDCDLK